MFTTIIHITFIYCTYILVTFEINTSRQLYHPYIGQHVTITNRIKCTHPTQ